MRGLAQGIHQMLVLRMLVRVVTLVPTAWAVVVSKQIKRQRITKVVMHKRVTGTNFAKVIQQ